MTFHRLIPESPYWLLSSGNYELAHKELKRIAKVNGKKVLSLNEIRELYEKAVSKEVTQKKYNSQP